RVDAAAYRGSAQDVRAEYHEGLRWRVPLRQVGWVERSETQQSMACRENVGSRANALDPTYGAGNNALLRPSSRYQTKPSHSCWAAAARWLSSARSKTGQGSTAKPALRKTPMARGMCVADVTSSQRPSRSSGRSLTVASANAAFSNVLLAAVSIRMRWASI